MADSEAYTVAHPSAKASGKRPAPDDVHSSVYARSVGAAGGMAMLKKLNGYRGGIPTTAAATMRPAGTTRHGGEAYADDEAF